ncbi:MAG: hypothetical protein LBV67_01575 [Streptococcaceae bacterium]|jgi:hypothetical protein|nr:hypothetical protein [Streptococcaceae bacterium]
MLKWLSDFSKLEIPSQILSIALAFLFVIELVVFVDKLQAVRLKDIQIKMDRMKLKEELEKKREKTGKRSIK